MRREATGGALAPHRRGSSAGFGRQYSLAHQASARLEQLAAEAAALSVAEGLGAALEALALECKAARGAGSRYAAMPLLKTVPGTKVAWDRPPLGLNRFSWSAARLAPTLRRGWKTLELSNGKFRRCAGRPERDTASSNGRQHPLHTRIGAPAQGSVSCGPQSTLYRTLYPAKPLGGC